MESEHDKEQQEHHSEIIDQAIFNKEWNEKVDPFLE